MGQKNATIHVRRQRGKLVVQGQGKTPRGTKFIRKEVPVKATKMSDPEFKGELLKAVDEINA